MADDGFTGEDFRGGYPEEPRPVGQCLRVVMHEECGHQRYAVRDLAVLEARHID